MARYTIVTATEIPSTSQQVAVRSALLTTKPTRLLLLCTFTDTKFTRLEWVEVILLYICLVTVQAFSIMNKITLYIFAEKPRIQDPCYNNNLNHYIQILIAIYSDQIEEM